jgi:hypothetical protein
MTGADICQTDTASRVEPADLPMEQLDVPLREFIRIIDQRHYDRAVSSQLPCRWSSVDTNIVG